MPNPVARMPMLAFSCCAIIAALGSEGTGALGGPAATSPANVTSPSPIAESPAPPPTEQPLPATSETPPPPATTETPPLPATTETSPPPATTETPLATTASPPASASGSPAPATAETPARLPPLNPALFQTRSPKGSELGELLDGPLRYFGDTTWSCETFGGSSETHVYERKDGDGFVLHNVLRTPEGKTYRLDETYSFDFSRRVWSVRQADGVYMGTSVLANDSYLIFEGNEVERAAPTLVRMRYHLYDDVYFRRDFEVLRSGHWVPYSGETCERASR